jgi:hypothetical protein
MTVNCSARGRLNWMLSQVDRARSDYLGGASEE